MSTPSETVELELTFLARELPQELVGIQPKRLVDVYVPEDTAVHPRLRIRQNGERYELTKKLPMSDGDASVHTEATIGLEAAEFTALQQASRRRVVKDRYLVTICGHPAEIDVFRETLAGLVLIDFEFASQGDKERFQPPSVCLADVTQEDFIAGGLLAGKDYASITAKLDGFGYQPIEVPDAV